MECKRGTGEVVDLVRVCWCVCVGYVEHVMRSHWSAREAQGRWWIWRVWVWVWVCVWVMLSTSCGHNG